MILPLVLSIAAVDMAVWVIAQKPITRIHNLSVRIKAYAKGLARVVTLPLLLRALRALLDLKLSESRL